MTAYEPEAHVHSLGLTLIPMDPGQGRLGLYIPRLKAILIHPDLHPHDRRPVLSHEIGHYETKTQHRYGCREEQRRTESECDRIAAMRLISLEDLEREVASSEDPGEWAYNLRVNGRMIRTRIQHLTQNEKHHLENMRKNRYAA